MPDTLPYVSGNVIAASAGTGKTYSLSSRFLALMALGADPASLVALTFTRKAAGEFCTRIFRDLAAGAAAAPAPGQRNPLTARLLETLSGLVAVGEGKACLLHPASNPVPLLPSTEFGAGADALMEEFCRRQREEAQPPKAPEQLCHAYPQLYADWDEGFFQQLLEKLVRAMPRLTLATFDSFFQRIAAAHCTELGISDLHPVTGEDADRARRAAIRALLQAAEAHEEAFCELYRDVADESSDNMVQRLEGQIKTFLSLFHRFPRAEQWSGAAFALPTHDERAQKVLRRTQGMYRLMQHYDAAYQRSVLSEGRCTFDDVARAAAQLLRRDDLPTEAAFDLNTRLRHWMLDEFQDTNPQQWAILEPLLDDALQSSLPAEYELEGRGRYVAHESSVFVVGDVKQSIYAFRGGTPDILQQMLPGDRPNRWRAYLAPTELQLNYRSAPLLLGHDPACPTGFVNRLFRRLHDMAREEGRPGDAAALTPDFYHHGSARQDLAGYLSVQALPEGDAEETREAMYREVEAILRDKLCEGGRLRPGISVGVLLRSNKELLGLYSYLRSVFGDSLPLCMVSDEFVALNTVMGELMLEFFRHLLHPSDEFRRKLLEMSPLRQLMLEHGADDWQQLAETRGYAAIVHRLLALLDPGERSRTAQEWLQAAQQFDAKGGTTEEWIQSICRLSYTADPPENSIRLMTMHKSKGLEFDAVILPLISSQNIDDTRTLSYLSTEDGQSVLLNPGDTKLREQLGLGAAVERWRAQRRAQEYNLLYVAVTRAKQALYILLHGKARPYKVDSKTKRYKKELSMTTSALIMRALNLMKEPQREQPDGCELLMEEGEPEWWRGRALAPSPAVVSPLCGLRAGKLQRRKRTPSTLHEDTSPAPSVLNAAGREAAAFGTAVHACFEQLEWLRADEEPAPTGQPEEARALVRAALREPSVRALFTRPATPCTVLNEQPLEAVLRDGTWLSATIDRLVLHGADAACTRILAADIIDYKTDRADAPELFRRHREQMRAYRQLVAAALDLPLAQVCVTLVSCPDTAAACALPFPPELLG